MSELVTQLRKRTEDAHEASLGFDFMREGGLATFWRQATPGTTYWRGYLPMLYLPGQLLPIGENSIGENPENPLIPDEHGNVSGELVLNGQEGDTAIWQFLGDDGRSRIALQMQRQGLRTLMEVDDTYLRFAPPLYGKFGAWTKTHADAIANGTGYSVEMHKKIVPQMDGIIVSTEHLAEEYSHYNANIYLCPNSVDPTDWDVERVESDVLRIAYYGSPSHVRDYPLAKKALKWAMRQPGVEVSFLGFSPPGWTGKTTPWFDDLYAARVALGAVDVGLAPITINHWSAGKSDVKAMEYAMAGVLPVLQDSPPYSPWRNSLDWPFMARTEEDWARVIREVVGMGKEAVAAEAARAKEYVLEHRTIQANVEFWREAVADG